ncbi:MAG: polysaccharide deacetylase family protein [Eubacteriales bacterium]|nr:polysaccharide deacetylase family protein [Eubacteriales bacterium]
MKQWTAFLMIITLLVCCAAEAFGASSVSLCGDEEITLLCGERYVEEGCLAFDTDGSDISDRVEISGEVCIWRPEDYELTYSVTDSDEVPLSCARKVKVIANTLPETAAAEKTIYLTYDDGPGKYTDELLDLLATYDAKATFFLIGKQVEKYPEELERILSAGHSIGVHCYRHDYEYIYSSEDRFAEDVLKTRELIFDKSGYRPDILRFAGGSSTAAAYSANKVDGGFETLTEILDNLGMRYFDWDISADPKDDGIEHSVRRVIKTAEKTECPIVIQHDSRSTCLKATQKILEWGSENGYTFEAIDLTVPEVHALG